MLHIDNIKKLSIIKNSDEPSKNETTKWLIKLEKDPLNRSQEITADWQGYKKLIS